MSNKNKKQRTYELTYWYGQCTRITVRDYFRNMNAAYKFLYTNDLKPLAVKFVGWQ